MAPTLIIGIGHLDRGDDAAGRIVASRLRERAPAHVEVIETDGEAAKLLDLMEGRDRVVIVDACLSGGMPGTIHRLDANAGPLPRPMFAMSSHAIGLVESIELARTLGTLPGYCHVLAIEAERFDLGVGLSPPVSAAVDAIVTELHAQSPLESA